MHVHVYDFRPCFPIIGCLLLMFWNQCVDFIPSFIDYPIINVQASVSYIYELDTAKRHIMRKFGIVTGKAVKFSVITRVIRSLRTCYQ